MEVNFIELKRTTKCYSSLSSFDSVAASFVFLAPLIAIAIFLRSVIVDPTIVGRLLYKE